MKRPISITVLCVLLALAWLLNCYSVYVAVQVVSPLRASWIMGTSIIAGASIIGLWKMKAWGPVLYLAGQAIGIAVLYLLPPEGAEAYPSWLVFLIPAIYAAVVLPNWRLLEPIRFGRNVVSATDA